MNKMKGTNLGTRHNSRVLSEHLLDEEESRCTKWEHFDTDLRRKKMKRSMSSRTQNLHARIRAQYTVRRDSLKNL